MKHLLRLLPLILLASPLFGQDTPQFFSFTSQATVLRLNGQSTPGTFMFGAVALTPTIGIGPESFLAPGINSQYYGGAVHKSLSFEKAISKTQLPKKSFQAYAHASFGIDRNVPATGNATQHYAGFLRGGLNYDPTGSGKFTVNLFDAGAAYLPGFPTIGPPTVHGNWGLTVSVGIKLTP